jgi:hypothetical protein
MILNRNPSRRDLSVFAVVLPLVALVVGVIAVIRFDAIGVAQIVWGMGAALTLVYLAVPGWRVPIFVGWMYATYPIGWILSHVVLLIVFFVVIVPFGVIARLTRRDPLARRVDRSAPSYWRRREPVSDVNRYFRQS